MKLTRIDYRARKELIGFAAEEILDLLDEPCELPLEVIGALGMVEGWRKGQILREHMEGAAAIAIGQLRQVMDQDSLPFVGASDDDEISVEAMGLSYLRAAAFTLGAVHTDRELVPIAVAQAFGYTQRTRQQRFCLKMLGVQFETARRQKDAQLEFARRQEPPTETKEEGVA